LEEHARQCAANVATTSDQLMTGCVQQIGWLSEQVNAIKGDCGAKALFALGKAVLANNNATENDADNVGVAGISRSQSAGVGGSGTASPPVSAVASTGGNTNSGEAVGGNGTNSAAGAAVVTSASINAQVSALLTHKQDLWLTIQRYRRSVALAESITQSFAASTRSIMRHLKQLKEKERGVLLTIIRIYTTQAAIGLPILCDRLTVFQHSSASQPFVDDEDQFCNDESRKEIAGSITEQQDEHEGLKQSIQLTSSLPPLPKLPPPIISGRALIASASVVRRYKDSKSPVPGDEDTADNMGVFTVDGVRWVPVLAVLTQGSSSDVGLIA
jgi:hypothetical protein